MTENTIHYFAGGHTAKGFYHLYETNVQQLNRLFILIGHSAKEKSRILEDIRQNYTSQQMECIHRASNPQALEAIIFPELHIGIVDEQSLPVQDESDQERETIDLCDRVTDEAKVQILQSQINEEQQLAYKAYHKALNIHDDWERIYIQQMDFVKADQVIDEFLTKAFNRQQSKETNPTIKRRFLGAATPEGAVDFVPNITEGLANRYMLKGRAGSGKSTFLKKVVTRAEELGYTIEIYHCGFDPKSLDMVVIRELGWAIFDSTKPHEYFPERDGDKAIDMYEKTITPGTDERFAKEIAIIESKYREQMNIAKKHLQISAELQAQLENYYTVDETYIEKLVQEIKQEMEHYIKSK